MRSTEIGSPDSADFPVIAIVEEVADHEGVQPTELSPPLQSAIDPEALNALVSSARSNDSGGLVRVEFEYLGYDIVLRSDGSVSVEDR